MINEDETLPKKCCANCGFLYCVARYAHNQDEIIFDPDILRDVNYPPPAFDGYGETFPGIISHNYFTNEMNTPHGVITEVLPYTWAYTSSFCCNWRVFKPLRLHESLSEINYRENAEGMMPIDSDSILYEIRKDRNDCIEYFPYHAGYSAKEHIELKLQNDRHKSNLDMQKYILDQELKFETRWRNYQRNQNLILGGIGILITLFSLGITLYVNALLTK